MATLTARGSRRRRTMNEINMVPFIDVMLVLLIIFMVSAPLITTGVVNLPSVGAAQPTPPHWIEVSLLKDGRYQLKLDGKTQGQVDREDLAAKVQGLQQAAAGGASVAQVPVVISAAKETKYDDVMQAMNALQQAKVDRVGLLVQPTGR